MVASTAKVFTLKEVAAHNTENDCWIVIGRAGAKKVYDFTPFIKSHPGGPELVLDNAGTDVNDLFEDIGHTTDALAMMDKLCIGALKEEPVATPASVKSKSPAPSAPSDNFFIYVCVLVVAAAAYLQY